MCKENGNVKDSDVGFYSGVIESLFSLTQMVVMILWGKAADQFGRKPVLVVSLVGVTMASSIFGLAKTIWQMMLFRCLAGVFAGTVVTVRTMISEHSTSKTSARAFSYFAFAGNLGILCGPLIGGALADPIGQYGGFFKNIPFFAKYPYALPSFAVGIIGVAITIFTAVCLEETLPAIARGDGSGGGQEAAVPGPVKISTLDLLKAPGVALVVFTYNHIQLLIFANTAILTVFWYTPVNLGGLGLSPLWISLFFGFVGLSQAIWILLVFPPLQHRIGALGVLRICAIFYPFYFVFAPIMNILLRFDSLFAKIMFWFVSVMINGGGTGVSMSTTAIQLLLNDAAPSPQMLGTLNAVSLAINSGTRSFSPALFASLYAVGANTQWLSGLAIWILMVALSLVFTVLSRYLPDYQKMESQREQGATTEEPIETSED